jgi:hypothetical protein
MPIRLPTSSALPADGETMQTDDGEAYISVRCVSLHCRGAPAVE